MREFAQRVRRSGYLPFYLAFGDANLKVADWMEGVDALRADARLLAELFLLQKEVDRGAVRELLGPDCHDEFLAAGLLVEPPGGATVQSNDFFLLSVRSWLLFCQINADPWAYFGEDSLALATYQTPCPGGNCLDLCAGPGIQSFVASAHAVRVTSVEIRPETVAVGEINRRLNGLGEDRMRFHCASVRDFADELDEASRFDRILFNPPLVPVPEGMDYAFVGHGGEDGLSLTCDIVSRYAHHLAAEGRIEFVGMGLGSGDSLPFVRRLEETAADEGLGGYVQIVSRHRAEASSILFENYAVSLAHSNGWELDDARSRMARSFADRGCDHFYLFFSSLGNDGKHREPLTVTDLSYHYYGNWFV